MSYADINFPTKKAFKEAVAAGKRVSLYNPGLGGPIQDGKNFVEGPHYPQLHKWYSQVMVKDGYVVSVK